jgi:hypothetical protein
MEDMLVLYELADDPQSLYAYMNESFKKLIGGDVRKPMLCKPGKLIQEEYEYVHNVLQKFIWEWGNR